MKLFSLGMVRNRSIFIVYCCKGVRCRATIFLSFENVVFRLSYVCVIFASVHVMYECPSLEDASLDT